MSDDNHNSDCADESGGYSNPRWANQSTLSIQLEIAAGPRVATAIGTAIALVIGIVL